MNLKPAMKATSSLAAAGVLIASSMAYADELRIVSWGGAYQKGQSVGIFQPVAKVMDITVKEDTYGGISDVKLMVKSGATYTYLYVDENGEEVGSVTIEKCYNTL